MGLCWLLVPVWGYWQCPSFRGLSKYMCDLQVDLRTSQLCQNGGMPGLWVVSLAVYAGSVGVGWRGPWPCVYGVLWLPGCPLLSFWCIQVVERVKWLYSCPELSLQDLDPAVSLLPIILDQRDPESGLFSSLLWTSGLEGISREGGSGSL